MIPLLRGIFHALLWDPMAARRWLRGACVTVAVGGVAFADQIAGIIGESGSPRMIKVIKFAAVACGFIGGATSIGERNPRPEGTP